MSAPQTRIKMDANRWSYQEYLKFAAAVTKGDMEAAYDLAEVIVFAWDYSLDLALGFRELPMDEATRAMRSILDTLSVYVETLKTDTVNLNMNKWKLKRFFEFQQLRVDGKSASVEAMLHEVASLPGTSVETPLTFEQGASMMKAFNDAYERMLKGKN